MQWKLRNAQGISFALSSLLILLAISLTQILFFEKIPYNDGLGFDGKLYADMVKHADGLCSSRKQPAYFAARMLPAVAVHTMIKVAGAPLDNRSIVAAFRIFNLVLLLLSALLWAAVADEVRLSGRNRWLGFIFLFFNFGILKMTFYNPILTDTAGFFLGMMLLCAYAKGWDAAIAACCFAGAFTWPTIAPFAALLFVLPRTAVVLPAKNSRLHWVAFAATASVILVVLVRFYAFKGIHHAGAGTQTVRLETLPVSIAAVLYYVYRANVHLLKNVSQKNMALLLRREQLIKSGIIAALWIVQTCIMRYVSVGDEFGIKQVAVSIVISSVLNPLIFIVSHVVYFGPVVCLLLLWCKDIGVDGAQCGAGMVAVLACSVPLSLFSESRCCIAVFPFVVFAVMRAAEKRAITPVFWVTCAICTVFSSKIWLHIGNNKDLYFMHFGPWMAEKWYCVQGGIAAVMTAAIWYVQKGKRSAPAQEPVS